jgi:hypothetical protein
LGSKGRGHVRQDTKAARWNPNAGHVGTFRIPSFGAGMLMIKMRGACRGGILPNFVAETRNLFHAQRLFGGGEQRDMDNE